MTLSQYIRNVNIHILLSVVLADFQLELLNLTLCRHTFNDSADSTDFLLETLISSLDIHNVVNNRDSVSCKTCNAKCCSCSKIRCAYPCSLKLLNTFNRCRISFYFDICTHSCELVKIFKTILEDTLCHNTCPFA